MSVETTPPRVTLRRLPKEIVTLLGVVAAIVASIAIGGLLAGLVPPSEASVWMTAGAYLAPAAAMFVLYWLMTQRL